MALAAQAPSRTELARRAAELIPLLSKHAIWAEDDRLPTVSASSVGTMIGLGKAAREDFFSRLPGRHITYTAYSAQAEAPEEQSGYMNVREFCRPFRSRGPAVGQVSAGAGDTGSWASA